MRGRSTLPASAIAGSPSAPVTDSAGRQVRLSSASRVIARPSAACAPANGYLRDRSLAQDRRRLPAPAARARRESARGTPRAARGPSRVLEPVEQGARDAERRRHDAARVARVHALGQHVDRQRAAGEAAQRRRRPEPLVVAAARIEADHEIDARRSAARAARDRRADRSCRSPRRSRSGRRSAHAARLAPAARRWRRATRTPRSRRRRRRDRRACRPRCTGCPRARGPRASRSSPAACRDGRTAAPCVSPRARRRRRTAPACGRAGARSRRARPRTGCARTQASASRITRSMWPFASHCGSKCGDLAGMRMYSTSCGTMDSFQVRVIVVASVVKSWLHARQPGWPRRAKGRRNS